MIEVAHGPHRPADLLQRVGLTVEPEGPNWAGQAIDAELYYDLIEHIAGTDDHGFPFRYAAALAADDLGALGLALKTAQTLEGSLERLVRYVLVLSDTLEYELTDASDGRVFALTGRPHHRRGAALANECALAAVVSMLRQVHGSRLTPDAVMFRHLGPLDRSHHDDFFGCPVSFATDTDGLRLSDAVLNQPTRLADDGLSAYLLNRLDELKARTSQRSLVDDVRAAIADALPDGQPSKSRIARRLGMSERTLHRHLADHGETFQTITTRARREAAQALLDSTDHSLADIGFLTGFADQTAFTRAFKRWTGHTPAAYRADRHAMRSSASRIRSSPNSNSARKS
ncbi:MAG: AraC family transcriptional regulator ligand-binding domain-containing protein [Acidimicrobiales bacterium]|nr:AraC family transcriptional regulator ligand-binding domain-containing protein [Acidimicrobiales bacterium]